ncbi:hypothetical protein AC579_500 [Pseudocercospora musae]|uniref:Uncharacterized protein n=1 Tax=Pseudocercospora musae TaxID=113226 RepID=A0A139I608_9PEZI|nr:hypothetical protein AC579_500 [Pseudocercospora musae]
MTHQICQALLYVDDGVALTRKDRKALGMGLGLIYMDATVQHPQKIVAPLVIASVRRLADEAIADRLNALVGPEQARPPVGIEMPLKDREVDKYFGANFRDTELAIVAMAFAIHRSSEIACIPACDLQMTDFGDLFCGN